MYILVFVVFAIVIFLLFCSVYLLIDRNRWRRIYKKRLQECNDHISSVEREYRDELSKEHSINMLAKMKIEKMETMLAGYRNTLSDVYTSLNQIIKSDYKTMGREVRSVILLLMDFSKRDDLKETAGEAETKKNNFIKQLMLHYPSITESSAQLAYLISINMPVQNISNIIGISAKSVQMARFRLRKKMELSPNDSLEEVLKKFKDENIDN